jgi:phage-related protein
MGGALRAAQEGETSGDATPMKGALRDVIEVREDDEAGTHRLMYTVEIPQADLNRIAGRLKTARRHAASLKDASR